MIRARKSVVKNRLFTWRSSLLALIAAMCAITVIFTQHLQPRLSYAQEALDDPTPNQEATAGLLTVYRPQEGNGGYAPFDRTAVPRAKQNDDKEGPGIRISNSAETDDLIELQITRVDASQHLALHRASGALKVWKSADKTAGEIPFTGNKTAELVFNPTSPLALTVFVEWADPNHGTCILDAEPTTANNVLDSVKFHTFKSIIIAIGGLGQSAPASGSGTGKTATKLYKLGYDAQWFPERKKGAAQKEGERAITKRGVQAIAMLGYSFGGGKIRDIAADSGIVRGKLIWTGYVDARDIGFGLGEPVDEKPKGSPKHLCQYETKSAYPGAATTTGLEAGTIVVNQNLNNSLPDHGAHQAIDALPAVQASNKQGITDSLTNR